MVMVPKGPTVPRPMRVLSLGAGVQSTAVLLMSLYGDLPPLDAAIFSDTGWEPASVYEHLEKLEAFSAERGLTIRRVSAGNIREDHINPTSAHLFIRKPRKHPHYLGKQRTFMPFFISAPEGGYLYRGDEEEAEAPTVGGTPGSISKERPGKTRRTCTKTYKIEPVEKELRVLLGLKPRQRWPLHHSITQVFGISYDEIQRMSDPNRPAITHEYPLVDMRMTRDDCHTWMAEHGWTAPRSACIGCPFHRNDEWRNLRDNAPEEWAEAVEFDHAFRARQEAGLLPMEGKPYLHDQRVPLDEAIIDDDGGMDMSDAECEGFCGV